MSKKRGYKPLSPAKISSILSNNASVVAQAKAACQPPAPPPPPLVPSPIPSRPITLMRSHDFDSLLAADKTREFLTFARDVISRFEGDQARQAELESETQDLLHYIELSPNMNAAQGYSLYRKLANIRRERRDCKNEIDLLKPLYDYLSDKKVINDLSQIQGKCSASKQSISRRQYTLRTDVMD